MTSSLRAREREGREGGEREEGKALTHAYRLATLHCACIQHGPFPCQLATANATSVWTDFVLPLDHDQVFTWHDSKLRSSHSK